MATAIETFEENARQVDRLIEIHGVVAGQGPGYKSNVAVLHKSAMVLLTAFWEAFCEDLAAEALEHIVEHAGSASALPKELRKSIASDLEGDSNDLAVWAIADSGWRDVLRKRMAALTTERNRRLNTPKTVQIDELFRKAVGMNLVSSNWRWKGMKVTQARDKLDTMVGIRGSIAHRGDAESAVVKEDVENYLAFIRRLAAVTHRAVNGFVSDATGKLFAD